MWGRNASSVRTVELDVRQSGQAVLKVTTRVATAVAKRAPQVFTHPSIGVPGTRGDPSIGRSEAPR